MAASLRYTPIHDSQLLPADLPQAMPAGQLPDNGKGPETERNASPIDRLPLLIQIYFVNTLTDNSKIYRRH